MKQRSVTHPIILNGITLEEFREIIQEFMVQHPSDMKIEVNEFDPRLNTNQSLKTKDSSIYLTRGEVAKQLQISLPTLHNYTKEGYIKSYRIGGKVRYKADDIEKALTERNFTAVNRKGGAYAA